MKNFANVTLLRLDMCFGVRASRGIGSDELAELALDRPCVLLELQASVNQCADADALGQRSRAHLSLELDAHPLDAVRRDEQMCLVEILDDKAHAAQRG